ncbi:hypothetical protein OHC33_008814 [Knufia fluminis]|uniref:Oxidoreductase n=1 Tax=Knufia fluminis TaxID=191047 RepID=A0AAN8E9V3_9EURO|nr:hypothetical protein OHC33_008814 [Knufia fluminis]
MSSNFDPNNIPSLTGRVFLVTGGTAGLGAASISLLATGKPAHIFFSGRNSKKADELIVKLHSNHPDVPVSFIQCDLTDLSSVKAAAEQFLAKADRLDVFYANAGIMALPPGQTKDGYEIQFGTNHMGHAMLIKMLLPLMERTAAQPGSDVRIINMSSIGYKQAPREGIAFDTLKTRQADLGSFLTGGGKWTRYGQSKLANLLYARELAKRYPSIKSVSVHPGYIKTDLFANVDFMTALPLYIAIPLGSGWTPVEQGAHTQTWAGTTARSNLKDGAHYVPVAKEGNFDTAHSRDMKLAGKLWDWTQKELEKF